MIVEGVEIPETSTRIRLFVNKDNIIEKVGWSAHEKDIQPATTRNMYKHTSYVLMFRGEGWSFLGVGFRNEFSIYTFTKDGADIDDQ